VLPPTVEHADAVTGRSMHHREPFHRFLVAQPLTEKMPLVSVDAQFDSYGITRLW
jgi:PIN domain nuclease of toxin-antitoxin system